MSVRAIRRRGRRGWLHRRLLGLGKRGGSPGRSYVPERSLRDELAGDDCEGREVMEKLLLIPEEAAAALGICRSKLYELLQAGVIESVHIGASRRIPVTAMVEYVERLRQEAMA
jgi:excisionase family DNA binding protein